MFVCLLSQSAIREIVREDEIPADMRTLAEEKRQELIECVTNGDELLGEMFLEDRKPTDQELIVSGPACSSSSKQRACPFQIVPKNYHRFDAK